MWLQRLRDLMAHVIQQTVPFDLSFLDRSKESRPQLPTFGFAPTLPLPK